jgi:hypothetical protein
MGVVREAVAERVTRGEHLDALRARTRAWLARHDVRVALAATLALPLAVVPATWLARGRPALRVGYVALAFLVWIMFLSEWVFWSWVN